MKLRSDPYIERYYQGLYSSDDPWVLPLQLPARHVLNTDSSDGPAEHWMCFFIDSDRSVDYMYSFGTVPWDKIYKWLIKHGFWPIKYNQKWLQHPTSNKCWAYSIYFLATWSQGLSQAHILRRFESYNFDCNNHLVISLTWESLA